MRILDWGVVAGAVALGGWLFAPGIGPDLLDLGESPTVSKEAVAGQNQDLLRKIDELRISSDPERGIPYYDRKNFGDGWADLNGDDCVTRNEILARDLDNPSFRPRTNNCVVQSGILHDPYTGETIQFQRGDKTSELVQIDHVVALADAWRAGAWDWSFQDRLEFANDPLNLLAVDGATNYDKGSQTADQWLPPNEAFVCEYVARQVAVKYHWDLTVTKSEADTMRKVLSSCPTVTLNE